MLHRWRWALLFGLAALLCGQTTTWSADQSPLLLQVTKKTVIDKSCIMMCDQWGDHGCLKWVMRCKGDPGYPKGLSVAQ